MELLTLFRFLDRRMNNSFACGGQVSAPTRFHWHLNFGAQFELFQSAIRVQLVLCRSLTQWFVEQKKISFPRLPMGISFGLGALTVMMTIHVPLATSDTFALDPPEHLQTTSFKHPQPRNASFRAAFGMYVVYDGGTSDYASIRNPFGVIGRTTKFEVRQHPLNEVMRRHEDHNGETQSTLNSEM